jgi:hypothetical protein
VFVLGETPIENSQDLTSAPYQAVIQIPANINLRSYGITAVGLDASGNSYSSSRVTIDVERTDNPTSIAANPTPLYKMIGDTSYVRVAATYADGAVLDATESSLVSYASGDPAGATVDNVGRVTAVGPGSANITIAYGTFSSPVPIVVPARFRDLNLAAFDEGYAYGVKMLESGPAAVETEEDGKEELESVD